LAASLNGEKKAFLFSPRWSADEARKIQRLRSRATTQPRRVSGRCTDSGPSMFSTDYLVICGRASACSMDSACATLEAPLDSSSHHRSTALLCATLSPRTAAGASDVESCKKSFASMRLRTLRTRSGNRRRVGSCTMTGLKT